MHRDIHPDNILCSSDGTNLKLIDFGVSRKFSSEKNDQEFENKIITVTGLFSYRAPEMMEGKEYSEKVDVWSAGVVLYECFSGTNPFMTKYKKDTGKNIINLPIKELITDELEAE